MTFEASSFFSPEGPPPGVGQLLIGFEPETFASGCYFDRLEILLAAVLDQPGTRLPGQRRLQNRELARQRGIEVSSKLYEQLMELNQ